MNVGLGWLGVGVGAAGCIAMYLLAGGTGSAPADETTSRDRRIAWLCAGATVIATLILWAIAMQKREPFSAGQGMALGFLIGGLTGAVAVLLTFRLSEIGATAGALRSTRLCTLSSLFFGLFAVSLVYSLFGSDPSKPLLGFAIGAVMAAIFHTYSQYVGWRELNVSTELWAVFAVTIAAAVLLAVEHFDATQFRMWWPLPILTATTALIAVYIGIEVGSIGGTAGENERSYLVAVFISAAILAGLSAIYAWKLYEDWSLLQVVAVGLGVAVVIAWLLSALGRDESEASLEAGAAVVVLIVAFVVVAFKLWSGLGIAIGLIAAWSVAIPALGAYRAGEAQPRSLVNAAGWPLVVGLAFVLFRLYLQYYRPNLRGADLGIHYTFIGAMLGAVVPFVFLAGLMRLRGADSARAESSTFAIGSIAAVAAIGLAAAAAPVVLIVLWGMVCGLGYVFGLTAAAAFMLLSRLAYNDIRYSSGLLAVAGLLTALAFAGNLADMEVTRAVRIIVLAGIVVLTVLWLGLSSVAARRAQ